MRGDIVREEIGTEPHASHADGATPRYVGILLAAGKGKRFDAAGVQNKLLQRLEGGDTVVACAAKNLMMALESRLGVISTGSPELAAHLSSIGFAVTECADAAQGMAASLVHGVRLEQDASGWIIALADMPFVRPTTIRAIAEALRHGAGIVVPVHEGRRGHPVGFGRIHLDSLLQLAGDAGARSLLERFPVMEIPVDDPGICQDIDTPADLRAFTSQQENNHAQGLFN